jgi:glutamate 5-kinase
VSTLSTLPEAMTVLVLVLAAVLAARLIDKIHVNDKKLEQVASRTGGSLGSGGMYTKVLAAKTAAKTNTNTVIVNQDTQSYKLSTPLNKTKQDNLLPIYTVNTACLKPLFINDIQNTGMRRLFEL